MAEQHNRYLFRNIICQSRSRSVVEQTNPYSCSPVKNALRARQDDSHPKQFCKRGKHKGVADL